MGQRSGGRHGHPIRAIFARRKVVPRLRDHYSDENVFRRGRRGRHRERDVVPLGDGIRVRHDAHHRCAVRGGIVVGHSDIAHDVGVMHAVVRPRARQYPDRPSALVYAVVHRGYRVGRRAGGRHHDRLGAAMARVHKVAAALEDLEVDREISRRCRRCRHRERGIGAFDYRRTARDAHHRRTGRWIVVVEHEYAAITHLGVAPIAIAILHQQIHPPPLLVRGVVHRGYCVGQRAGGRHCQCRRKRS